MVQPTHRQELGHKVLGGSAHCQDLGHKVLGGSAHTLSRARTQGD